VPTIYLLGLDAGTRVPGVTAAQFTGHAEAAKKGCPVSKARAGPEIRRNAGLLA